MVRDSSGVPRAERELLPRLGHHRGRAVTHLVGDARTGAKEKLTAQAHNIQTVERQTAHVWRFAFGASGYSLKSGFAGKSS